MGRMKHVLIWKNEEDNTFAFSLRSLDPHIIGHLTLTMLKWARDPDIDFYAEDMDAILEMLSDAIHEETSGGQTFLDR